MNDKGIKIVSKNKKAFHDYEIIDSYEAGLVLLGTEVKAVRENKVSMVDAYARFRQNELWVIGLHISPFSKSDTVNHEPLRDRKLLLNKQELKKILRQVNEKGVTLIPLKVYLKRHLVKVEIGLARGKRKYDKRAAIADRDMKRELDRKQKSFNQKY